MNDRGRVPGVVRCVVLSLAGLLLGALLGAVWEAVWTPPLGVTFEGEWYLDGEGLAQDVAATGWFAVLGFVGGLAFGLVAARFSGGRELATLVGVCLGSGLAVWAMVQVGHALGPPDPRGLAARLTDYETLPGDLRVARTDSDSQLLGLDSSAYLVLPAAALLGLVTLFLGGRGSRSVG